MSDFNIRFKFIKGVKKMLADTLSRYINLEIAEPNPPEQLPNIHVDSNKHEPMPPHRYF